jgi:lysyl-tRNA synthetase class 1
VFTPQVWYRYASPQSLNLLIFKRFVGTKSGSVEDIQSHADELDDIEDIYFGKRKIKDFMEEAKLKGLYEYCWMMKPPEEPEVHVPFNLMINLARVTPKDSEEAFIREKLEVYGYLKEGDKGIDRRLTYALKWMEDFGTLELQKVELTKDEVKVIKGLIKALKSAETEEDYQSAVFEVARTYNVKPRNLFQILYTILLGRSQGPRFGPYVSAIGKDNVILELGKAL